MKILRKSLLVLFLVSGFLSATASLAQKSNPEGVAQMRFLLSCDPTGVLPAKIMAGVVTLALTVSPDLQSEFEGLNTSMMEIQSCEELPKYYEPIKAFATKVGLDLEAYFATPDGQAELAGTIDSIKQAVGK